MADASYQISFTPWLQGRSPEVLRLKPQEVLDVLGRALVAATEGWLSMSSLVMPCLKLAVQYKKLDEAGLGVLIGKDPGLFARY